MTGKQISKMKQLRKQTKLLSKRKGNEELSPGAPTLIKPWTDGWKRAFPVRFLSAHACGM